MYPLPLPHMLAGWVIIRRTPTTPEGRSPERSEGEMLLKNYMKRLPVETESLGSPRVHPPWLHAVEITFHVPLQFLFRNKNSHSCIVD